MSGLQFKQFACQREDYPLFKPLDFTVSQGDIVQVAGPNGAGKTTMLRSVCGLYGEWTGELLWNGTSYRTPHFDMKADMLYLGHQPGVKKALTARESLAWSFGIQGFDFPKQVEAALQAVGLKGYEDIYCFNMSAGQLRRVALARLFIARSVLWVLDEPFTAIDKAGVGKLEDLIEDHAANGGIVILTTHQALDIKSVRLIELEPCRTGAML